jgi:hypothetical protein
MVGSHGVGTGNAQRRYGDISGGGVGDEVILPDFHPGNCQRAEVLVNAEDQLILLQSGVQTAHLNAVEEVLFNSYPTREFIGSVAVTAIVMERVIVNHDLAIGMQTAKVVEVAVILGNPGQYLAGSISRDTDSIIGRPPGARLMVLGGGRRVVAPGGPESEFSAFGCS